MNAKKTYRLNKECYEIQGTQKDYLPFVTFANTSILNPNWEPGTFKIRSFPNILGRIALNDWPQYVADWLVQQPVTWYVVWHRYSMIFLSRTLTLSFFQDSFLLKLGCSGVVFATQPAFQAESSSRWLYDAVASASVLSFSQSWAQKLCGHVVYPVHIPVDSRF